MKHERGKVIEKSEIGNASMLIDFICLGWPRMQFGVVENNRMSQHHRLRKLSLMDLESAP